MPEVETYGAQPPIELIRQLVDNGGWNSVTPRFLRHFNLFCFAEFDDGTLKRIFSTI
eukprot:gene45872-58736_t